MADEQRIAQKLEEKAEVHDVTIVSENCVLAIRSRADHEDPAVFHFSEWKVAMYHRQEKGDLILFVPEDQI